MISNNFSKLKKILGKNLEENIELKKYTTMRVGGVADYFYVAKTIDDLIKAVLATKKLNIPYVVIGGGSNIIVSDFGFAGLVILNRASNIAKISDKSQLIVDSGVNLTRLVMETVNFALSGLEALVGIPGTIGGAVYGNAGAYGTEISNLIKSITLLSPDGKIVRYHGDWLKPSYRCTRLKQLKKSGVEIPIILSVKLQLSSNKREEILKKIQYYQAKRLLKIPYDKPSAGSIFKNPYPRGTAQFAKEKTAGAMLENIGAKKLRLGDAQVSVKHANIIINNKNAKASEIRKLIEQLREEVNEKYHILLEEEVEYVGQWK